MRTPSPDEAVERAQRALDSRISTVRQAVEARQHITDVLVDAERQRAELETRIGQHVRDAERADIKAYSAALKAGWSAEELRKIGLTEPAKQTRTRRRAARKPVDLQTTPPTPQQVTQDDAGESALSRGSG